MNKITMVALALVALTGCEPVSTVEPNNNSRYNITEICVDGVAYYQFIGYKKLAVAPAYNTDGTLKLCDSQGDQL
jgi:hypothetical protein